MSKPVGNPHHLCTWDENSNCEPCPERDRLNCKWDRKLLYSFFMLYLPFLVSSWLALVLVGHLAGAWWPLIAYGAFYIIFFGFLEIRILCSHCPYYGGDSGFSLRCLANNGAMKIWKYHPEPMNRLEKNGLVAGFIFLGGWPIAVAAYGICFLTTHYTAFSSLTHLAIITVGAATLASSLSFFYCLKTYVCSRCLNFSCPMNTVPDDAVEVYLKKNPVMGDAWK